MDELIQGRDGKVREAMVKVSNPNKNTSRLRRVIQHLYPIEFKREDREKCGKVGLIER